MLVKEKIKNETLFTLLETDMPDFPKYTTQLMNLANQNSQGTRPQFVGQMSELIQEFDGESIDEWKAWYLKKNPHAIDDATERIFSMIKKLKQSMREITKDMVREWVTDLIITKTYTGFNTQMAILKYLANSYDAQWRAASPAEEAQNIDGVVGAAKVSIKPDSFKGMLQLPFEIKVHEIYYKKMKDGVLIEYDKAAFEADIKA